MKAAQMEFKITLPQDVGDLLLAKANSLGLSVAQFIKKLITKEESQEKYPKFRASKATIRETKQAMKDYEAGKATIVNDVHVFFKNL